MKYYAALLHMLDPQKSQELRPQHLAYLDEKRKEGKIFAQGRFMDGAGGLIIYIASSEEEAMQLASGDPFIANQARKLELHEWELIAGNVQA